MCCVQVFDHADPTLGPCPGVTCVYHMHSGILGDIGNVLPNPRYFRERTVTPSGGDIVPLIECGGEYGDVCAE